MKKGYFDKKKVYGDNPLSEIIYELEDELVWSEELGQKVIPHDRAKKIFERHSQTIRYIGRLITGMDVDKLLEDYNLLYFKQFKK